MVKNKGRNSDHHSLFDMYPIVRDIFIAGTLQSYCWWMHSENFINEIFQVGHVLDHFMANVPIFLNLRYDAFEEFLLYFWIDSQIEQTTSQRSGSRVKTSQ